VEHGLNTGALAVVCACVVVWGLVAEKAGRWNISGPMAFVAMGLVLNNGPLAIIHIHLHSSTVRSLAEVALALVLFVDASRVHARVVRAEWQLPTRLLAIGLPLTIGAGAAAAAVVVGGDAWVAAAIGAMVAPTDAALGASILQDRRIPGGVRRLLNVESGLNDGIATPFVNLFLAGALASESVGSSGVAGATRDLVIGALIGIGAGAGGAVLHRIAGRAGWSSASFRSISVLGLALLSYSVALEAGANGFVAAFVAGMAFGTTMPDDVQLLGFAEDAGELLSLLVWFAFGAVMIVPGVRAAGWNDVVFGVLALSLVRMVPVALALAGAGLDRATVALIGWFGPRGLATVVFGLIAVDSLAADAANRVLGAVSVTVAISVMAHGVSASPLARRYARRLARSPAKAQGRPPAPAIPVRAHKGTRPPLGWAGI
jgi:NhaP-type Na+/H+ or K+/H+ antiporter